MVFLESAQIISTILATTIYSLKNIKHLSICCGIFQCSQKIDNNEAEKQINELNEHINLLQSQLGKTTELLKKSKAYISPREELNLENEIKR